jgi:hypothetical protein
VIREQSWRDSHHVNQGIGIVGDRHITQDRAMLGSVSGGIAVDKVNALGHSFEKTGIEIVNASVILAGKLVGCCG